MHLFLQTQLLQQHSSRPTLLRHNCCKIQSQRKIIEQKRLLPSLHFKKFTLAPVRERIIFKILLVAYKILHGVASA